MTTTQETAGWSHWLNERSQDERHALMSAMIQGGWGPELPPEDAEPIVKLLRPPVEDFIGTSSPPYVDVHQLTDFFNLVAYNYNILLKGPKGCGKSLAVDNFAYITKTPKITMNCSEDSKEKHILGNFIIKQGLKGIESPWVLGAVAKAIDIANEYGRAILVFEEVNALTPQIQKQLNSLLDFRKSVDIGQLSRSFKLRENAFLWVVGTMNPSVYGGTYELNEDLRSRWIDVDLGYPNKAQERAIIDINVTFTPRPAPAPDPNKQLAEWNTMVDTFIKLGGETRTGNTQYALSSRDLVTHVRLVKDLGLEQALQLLVCKFEGDDKKTVLSRISTNFKGIHIKETWNA